MCRVIHLFRRRKNSNHFCISRSASLHSTQTAHLPFLYHLFAPFFLCHHSTTTYSFPTIPSWALVHSVFSELPSYGQAGHWSNISFLMTFMFLIWPATTYWFSQTSAIGSIPSSFEKTDHWMSICDSQSCMLNQEEDLCLQNGECWLTGHVLLCLNLIIGLYTNLSNWLWCWFDMRLVTQHWIAILPCHV